MLESVYLLAWTLQTLKSEWHLLNVLFDYFFKKNISKNGCFQFIDRNFGCRSVQHVDIDRPSHKRKIDKFRISLSNIKFPSKELKPCSERFTKLTPIASYFKVPVTFSSHSHFCIDIDWFVSTWNANYVCFTLWCAVSRFFNCKFRLTCNVSCGPFYQFRFFFAVQFFLAHHSVSFRIQSKQ